MTGLKKHTLVLFFHIALAILWSGAVSADMSLAESCALATHEKGYNVSDNYLDQIRSDDEKVVIFSDTVNYREDQHLELEGHVEIIRGDVQVFSDRAEIDQSSQNAKLLGNVNVQGPEMSVSGDSAFLNMESKETEVQNAEFLSEVTRIRGQAEKIHVPTTQQLNIENGFFTTCAPGNESWSFVSSDIRLDQEAGRGVAKHSRFQIYDTPILYIPWFSFAIDDRRASGFLYPQIGTANTGSGLFVTTPYYFNIAPQFDATLTPSLIRGRGMHNEVEARYLTELGRTTFAVGYIDKDDHYVDERESDGKQDAGDRWGLSFEQGIQFDTNYGRWMGKVDYSAVSDEDYLDDLNQGLQIDGQDYLDRRATIALNYDTWHLKALVQQYAVLDDDNAADDRPYQRLPEVSLQMNHHFGGVHLNWLSEYVYFYRDDDGLAADERVHGSRMRHRPNLALPFASSWGYVEPGFTVDHTDYLLQDYVPQNNHIDRTIPIYELDAGLYLDRSTSLGDLNLRHSIEPRAYYVRSDAEGQNDIPVFDSALPDFYFDRLFKPGRFVGGDRISDQNRYTLGVTMRWSDLDAGRDWARISLAYIHHLSDSSVDLEGVGRVDDNDRQFAGEVVVSPLDNFTMSFSGLWDKQSEEMIEGYSKLSYRSDDFGYVLNAAHRYRDGSGDTPNVEQLDISAITPLSRSVSVLGRWRHELIQHNTIGSLLGFEYRSCCWRAQLLGQRYLTDDGDMENGVLLRFQLIGLGSYGEDRSMLDDQIPGYAAREEYLH